MNYEIKTKNDFTMGASLLVCIPENELDVCVFNTINTDCPDFILPFSYVNNNGRIELTYKIGTLSKLLYFAGDFFVKEYIELWTSLLEPLIECFDWYMKPCSFVFNADFLYYDKNKKKVVYLYIPSTCECSDSGTLNSMVLELAKVMTVSDAKLENKVLRAIMAGFSPADILKMLKEYSAGNDSLPDEIINDEVISASTHREQNPKNDDIAGLSERLSPVESSEENFYSTTYTDIDADPQTSEKEPQGFKIFGGKSKKKKRQKQKDNEISSIGESNIVPGSQKPPKPIIAVPPKVIEITQSTPVIDSGTGLKYIGSADFPGVIQVNIEQGDIFTIGRYDSALGKKQSSFEFDRKTKAISRRHAVIERDENGYKIIDLSSSAGTFVNSQKLLPNTPFELEAGTRISFGNLGADYVWEVN